MRNILSRIKKSLHNNGYLFIIIIPSIYILLLAITAFFAHPNGEDLYKANISKNAGIINAAIDQYIIYDGRYFTNILHGFIPPVWSNPSNQYISALFFLTFFICSSFYFFTGILTLAKKSNTVLAFALSILFTASYTAIIPELEYFMFLCPGGIVYGFSASILLLFLGAIIRLILSTNSKNALILLFFVIVLEIISIGMNEMNLVFTSISVFLFFIYTFFFHTRTNLKLDGIILLIIGLTFSIFSISSPGIGLDREMNFNGLYNFDIIILSLKLSFSFTLGMYIQWLQNAPYHFLLPFIIYILIYKKISLKILIIAPIILIPISLFILCLSNTTYVLPFHDVITIENFPTRIQNTAQLFYLLINIVGIILIEKVKSPITFFNTSYYVSEKKLKIHLPLLFSILFFIHPTPINLISDWSSGRIQNYNNKMNHRYKTINEAKANGDKVVELETIFDLPYSITDNVKLSTHMEDQLWVKSYEMYFDIKIIMKD